MHGREAQPPDRASPGVSAGRRERASALGQGADDPDRGTRSAFQDR
jgi:hypothetical protein